MERALAAYAGLASNYLVSIQPMNAPASLVFYPGVDPRTGDPKSLQMRSEPVIARTRKSRCRRVSTLQEELRIEVDETVIGRIRSMCLQLDKEVFVARAGSEGELLVSLSPMIEAVDRRFPQEKPWVLLGRLLAYDVARLLCLREPRPFLPDEPSVMGTLGGALVLCAGRALKEDEFIVGHRAPVEGSGFILAPHCLAAPILEGDELRFIWSYGMKMLGCRYIFLGKRLPFYDAPLAGD